MLYRTASNHQLPTYTSDLEPLPIVILTLLPSVEIRGQPDLALEAVDIQNVRAKVLA